MNYQLPSTEYINLRVLNEPGQKIQYDYSGNLHNKHVTGELYDPIGIDRCSEKPVIRICKSTEAKKIIKCSENFINFTVSQANKIRERMCVHKAKIQNFCEKKDRN